MNTACIFTFWGILIESKGNYLKSKLECDITREYRGKKICILVLLFFVVAKAAFGVTSKA